ncbi:MAG TPA: hypothetical protein VEZ44_08205 [bacterium]|nr:hypothetical protein [bacterium]
MRQLLAAILLGGALLTSVPAAFANDNTERSLPPHNGYVAAEDLNPATPMVPIDNRELPSYPASTSQNQ